MQELCQISMLVISMYFEPYLLNKRFIFKSKVNIFDLFIDY
jgi:hypothetical protein